MVQGCLHPPHDPKPDSTEMGLGPVLLFVDPSPGCLRCLHRQETRAEIGKPDCSYRRTHVDIGLGANPEEAACLPLSVATILGSTWKCHDNGIF